MRADHPFIKQADQTAREKGAALSAAAISIAADNKRSVGQITLSYPDQATLATILEAAIEVLKTRAQDYFPQLGGQPARITILDVPQINATAAPIANRFAPLIRLGLAFLMGAGLAFLAEYLDPWIRRREQVEMLGLNVIDTLPRD